MNSGRFARSPSIGFLSFTGIDLRSMRQPESRRVHFCVESVFCFTGRAYDISDDNADDSCTRNYVHNRAFRLLNSLFSALARSWQCGGQGFESP
jgi:hypothetical protein